ncbi:hypothetical protein [Streptomyces sp. NPDC001450]
MAAHLNREFRTQVCEGILPEGLKADGPSFGVDLLAVWRHASHARDLWQDAADSLDVIRLTSASTALISVFGICAAFLLSPWWILVFTVAASLTAGSVLHGRKSLHKVVTQTVASASDLRRVGVEPRKMFEPRDSGDEERITTVEKANLIVYSPAALTPFIGSGIPVEHVVMPPIDVGIAASDGDGDGDTKTSPTAFTTLDVHNHLMSNLASWGLDSVDVAQRLYIRGDVIATPGRTPWADRTAPPPSKVDDAWVKAGVLRPTGRARTYLCLERRLNGGQLVVSMFVRASLQGRLLSLEIATHALPGLDVRFRRLSDPFDDFFDAQLDPVVGQTVAGACEEITRRLLWRYLLSGSWEAPTKQEKQEGEAGEKSEEEQKNEEARKEREEAERSAALGERAYDFGAESSFRERTSRLYISDYFEMLDAQDCLQRMQRSVIDCLGDFLTKQGVDTSEFRARKEQIINNNTFQIHRVDGTGHHIGPQGKVSNVQAKSAGAGSGSGERERGPSEA